MRPNRVFRGIKELVTAGLDIHSRTTGTARLTLRTHALMVCAGHANRGGLPAVV
jgi:hypothetical protein